MQKFPKTTKIEVRIEDILLDRIPDQGRDRWINDACRQKLDGPSRSKAASAMGAAKSEKKTIAARKNAKKPRLRKKPDNGNVPD